MNDYERYTSDLVDLSAQWKSTDFFCGSCPLCLFFQCPQNHSNYNSMRSRVRCYLSICRNEFQAMSLIISFFSFQFKLQFASSQFMPHMRSVVSLQLVPFLTIVFEVSIAGLNLSVVGWNWSCCCYFSKSSPLLPLPLLTSSSSFRSLFFLTQLIISSHTIYYCCCCSSFVALWWCHSILSLTFIINNQQDYHAIIAQYSLVCMKYNIQITEVTYIELYYSHNHYIKHEHS
jgi:hypothetical protein